MVGARRVSIAAVPEDEEQVALFSRDASAEHDAGPDGGVHKEEGLAEAAASLVPGIARVKSNRFVPAAGQGQRCRVACLVACALAAAALVALAAARPSTSARAWFAARPGEPRAGSAAQLQGKATTRQMEPWPTSGQASAQMVPWPSSCVYGETLECPAKGLFLNPEVHDVAAENLMRIGLRGGLLTKDDRALVLDVVAKVFSNIGTLLHMYVPEVARELDAVPVTAPQKDAILESMRLLGDVRVQALGRGVILAVHSGLSVERPLAQLRVERAMMAIGAEIQKLRREVLPDELANTWAIGREWNLTLGSENIRMTRTSGHSLSSVTRPQSGALTSEEKRYSLSGGVSEEARALVDIIQWCVHFSGNYLRLPAEATALAGNYSLVAGPLSCDADRTHRSGAGFPEEFVCALKFGMQGLGALRASVKAQSAVVA